MRNGLILSIYALAMMGILPLAGCSSSQGGEDGVVVLMEDRDKPDLDEELPDVDDDPNTPRNEASLRNRRRLRDTDFADDYPETPLREDAMVRDGVERE